MVFFLDAVLAGAGDAFEGRTDLPFALCEKCGVLYNAQVLDGKAPFPVRKP